MINKLFALIILFIFITIIYAEDRNLRIKAEYCLHEDTSMHEMYISQSKYQLKISRLIENLDNIRLQKEKLSCSWLGTSKYALVDNSKIRLLDGLPFIITEIDIIDIKASLKSDFSDTKPWQTYHILLKREYDMFNSLTNKKIFIKWVKESICDDIKDSITGGYYIKIKGKCNEEDLLWNAKYDIRKISNPIDTLDLNEKLGDAKYYLRGISSPINTLDLDEKSCSGKYVILWNTKYEYDMLEFINLWKAKCDNK